jgi:preprotein translocase subunit SecE
MASQNDDQERDPKADAEEPAPNDGLLVPEASAVPEKVSLSDDTSEGHAKELGVERYVHAAFLGAGILFAYICGKVSTSIWNSLADWPAAVRAVPVLVRYPEEEREGFTLAIGAVLGAILAIQLYRRPGVRNWADEVAAELAKVTWPNREIVVNGTLVVVIATTVGTIYVSILDRFWGFLTNLVYGT